MKGLPHIEQCGLIGDTQTSAHVCDDGSIDWLCLPRFDSPSVFAGLLGTQQHGIWQIAPAASAGRSGSGKVAERRYRGDSLVLESVWHTPTGSVRVLDFMPPREGAPQVIRLAEGLTGEVEMVSAMRPRPGAGSISPRIRAVGGRTVAEAGADALWLDTCVPQTEKDGVVVSAFAIGTGQSVAFVLSWCPSHAAAPDVPDPEAALAETLAFWQAWTQGSTVSVARPDACAARDAPPRPVAAAGLGSGVRSAHHHEALTGAVAHAETELEKLLRADQTPARRGRPE